MRAVRGAVSGLLVMLLLASCASAAPTPTPTPTPKLQLGENPRALFLGDSWTAGYSAEAGHGFAEVASASLGWTETLGPNGSGVGFVNVAPAAGDQRTLPQIAAALPSQRADVVVIEGGLNDVDKRLNGLESAVRSTIKSARAASGAGAAVIVVGPPPLRFPVDASLRQVDATMRRATASEGALYISPLRDQWFDQRVVSLMIDPATGHPDTAGHAYFGGRLAEAIREFE